MQKKLHRIIITCILSASSFSTGFFALPSWIRAPHWPGDTRIATPTIISLDGFIDTGGSTPGKQCVHTIQPLNSYMLHTLSTQWHITDVGLSTYATLTAGFFFETNIILRIVTIQRTPMALSVCQNTKTGITNSSFLAGWSINYDQIPIFDFFDLTIRAGIVTPMAGNFDCALGTALGYPEWGIPFAGDVAIGLCDWMTYGLHTSTVLFFDPHMHRTYGPVWEIAPYFKADHAMRGFSFWLGYAFTGSFHDHLPLCFQDHSCKWHMHTLQYGIEYECIQELAPVHPRIGLQFNQVIGGSNILKTNMLGCTIGIDFTW